MKAKKHKRKKLTKKQIKILRNGGNGVYSEVTQNLVKKGLIDSRYAGSGNKAGIKRLFSAEAISKKEFDTFITYGFF